MLPPPATPAQRRADEISGLGGAPVARWLFDEASGTIAHDSNVVGPPNNGTLVGGVPPTLGPWGALTFNGSGGYDSRVQLQNDLDPVLGGTASLTVWIKSSDGINEATDNNPYDSPAIIGAGQGSGLEQGGAIVWGFQTDDGTIGLAAGSGAAVVSSSPIDDSNWHLVALTRDADTGQEVVYVDGVLSGSAMGEVGFEDVSLGGGSLSNLGGTNNVGYFLQSTQLRDLRVYDRVLSAREVADLVAPPMPNAPGAVVPASITLDLQSAVNSLEGAGGSAPADFVATTTDQVTAFLAAVGNVYVSPNSSPVNVILDAQNNTFNGQTVSVPPNMVLTINGATFVGHSPSLTIATGTVVVTNSTLTNATDAPTILVLGGSLKLRNDTIQESSGYSQAAIEIDGGSVDLGSAADPGNNTLDVNGAGVLLRSGTSGPLIPLEPHAGNTFQINGRTASADSNLQGMAWVDFNNDGNVDFGEQGIAGISITLTGTDLLGNHVQQALSTDTNGLYSFGALWPGTYSITEGSVPSAYVTGKDAIGSTDGTNPDGSNPSHSLFSNIAIGVDQNGLNYNFGQQPAPGSAVSKGQSAGIGFWNNKNGQKLIASFDFISPNTGVTLSLGNWLAATMPNTFGNLAGMSAAQVAQLFQQKFVLTDKLDAQVLATALNVYATDRSLGGPQAASYGFTVGTYGLGDSTWNVGSDGAAFGVANNSTWTIMQLLNDYDGEWLKGLWNGGSASVRKLALDTFGGINARGGI